MIEIFYTKFDKFYFVLFLNTSRRDAKFCKKETADYFATKLSNVYFREYDACLYCIFRIQATLTLHEPWSLLFLYSIMDRYNFYLLSIVGYTFLYFFFLNIAFNENDLVHGGLNLIVSVRFHLNSSRTRSNSSIAYFLQRSVVWRRNVRHEPTAWPLINLLIYFLNVLFVEKFLYSFCRLISVNFADYSAE